jgi:gamma-polyglutamate synthase
MLDTFATMGTCSTDPGTSHNPLKKREDQVITGIEILAGATVALMGLGGVESLLHRQRLRRIPIRIHVAGTRGKSSVTRLLAAGLQGAGIPTAAKTTGTLPRMILPSGREVPVFRPSGSNIIEQKRIVAAACALQVEALVIECMALRPSLHWVSEKKLIRATHGVITNARADHLDVMGPTDRHVAQCLAGMIPVKGRLYTAEEKHLDIIEEAARDRRSECTKVTPEEIRTLSRDEMSRFSYMEHAANVCLCLRILSDLGIDRDTALQGMWRTRPDPGALTEQVIDFFGREMVFVNGFAANDPVSTRLVWEMAIEAHRDIPHTIAVFNLRADRPDRTIQLARHTDFWHRADKVVLMGAGAYSFAKLAVGHGLDSGKLVYADFDRVDDIFEAIVGVCRARSLVVGMGNIGGLGLFLRNYFKNRAIPREEAS